MSIEAQGAQRGWRLKAAGAQESRKSGASAGSPGTGPSRRRHQPPTCASGAPLNDSWPSAWRNSKYRQKSGR